MPATVAAARWSDDLDIEISQKTPAAPGPGQVQLAVGSAGICGSDLHFYRGQFPAPPASPPATSSPAQSPPLVPASSTSMRAT